MSEEITNRPTPINREVVWDKTKTIISTTDKYGTITDVNQTFIDVCGYSADELLGKPHNIIRHPDMPKIIFKVTWDNILAGRNFHGIIKNLAKSGEYYWVITDFEVGRNIMGEVVTIMARRRAVPQYVITDHIEPLYQTLLKLEKIGGMELSNRYFKGFLEKQGKSIKDLTIAVQGFGNVGSVGALLMHREGAKIVAIGDVHGSLYNANGIDVEKAYEYANSHGRSLEGYEEPGMTRIPHPDLLLLDVDVLYLAALENQVNEANMKDVKAKLILEGANGPLTKDADLYFFEKGIPVLPDVLANGGGVVVSYYEWVQNKAGFYWSEEEVNEKLAKNMKKSFEEVWAMQEEFKVYPRLAAYMVALRRLVEALKIKGYNG